jgi:uncharacterized protein (DUF4415 family)
VVPAQFGGEISFELPQRENDMKKNKSGDALIDLDVPEIPRNAQPRKPRHRPSADAKMPRKKTTLDLDVDIIAWLEAEQRRSRLNVNNHVNLILRQYITSLIGDQSTYAAMPLTDRQRDEVKQIIEESLSQKGLVEHEMAG